ncbi:ATP-grasp domain-containing protein [Bradyrhizobium sp. HKCCYLS1011]|uniref:ATP-grasp domain-containing protein n=1 Tax=Bradyrhizobium sp. HKCCYLS1011 TaxID=3420733 RepID=UPI003EBB86F9
MPKQPRILIEAIRRYCAEHGIGLDIRADGWLLVLERGSRRHLIFGYDLGLNSAVAHRLACDKAATADLLAASGVPVVSHAFFLAPVFDAGAEVPWAAMVELLETHPSGLVVKPNEGTSGRGVMRVRDRDALMQAVNGLFATHDNVAISPFLDVEDEVRIVLLDGIPLVVYRKVRPSVTGDGARTLQELALAALSPALRARMLPLLQSEFTPVELAAIVPAGERRLVTWRHNLEAGAKPMLLQSGAAYDACVALAAKAAQAIGIRFASVDAVQSDGRWQVLEINSGVVMETLAASYPALVQAAYRAALDELLGETRDL